MVEQIGDDTNQNPREMTHHEAVRASVSAPRNYPAAIDQPRERGLQPKPAALVVWSNAPYTPTPSLDPGNVKAIYNDDPELKGYLAPAEAAFSNAHEALKAVAAARNPLSRDTSKTDEQKLLAMAERSEKALERITRGFDAAHKNLTAAANALDESLSRPLESVTHTALCQEIRAHIKGLKQEERGAFVLEAINRGNVKVLNAVLGTGLGFLSGIEEPMLANYTRIYRERHAPEATRRLAACRKALELLETRAHLCVTEMERAQGGKSSDVRRLRGQVDASDKALRAIGG